jgi:hypothetical protein
MPRRSTHWRTRWILVCVVVLSSLASLPNQIGAQENSQTVAPAQSNYGAIAVSTKTEASSAGAGYTSPREAERRVLELCAVADCAVVLAFEDGCGVLVWDDRARHVAAAAALEEAEQRALGRCRGSCEIRHALCVPREEPNADGR